MLFCCSCNNSLVLLNSRGLCGLNIVCCCCGLGGLGIKSRWDEIFHIHSDQLWGPPSLLYNGHRGLPGVKCPGRGVDHPPPSSTELKETVELYLYSPSSYPVPGRTLLCVDATESQFNMGFLIWRCSIPFSC